MLIALPFVLALAVTALLTPRVRRWALVVGAVDRPGPRKVHAQPMPRMGGLAVYVGFWLATLAYGWLNDQGMPVEMAGMFGGTLIMVLLGAFDDLGDAPVRVKLPVQIAAAHVAYFFGVRFDLLTGLFDPSDAKSLSQGLAVCNYVLTILWIVGITNALNFMDGLDGLATSVALAAAITLAVVAAVLGAPMQGPLLGALVGALLGYWPYARFPAKIFLGDTGSTFLGFSLACFGPAICQTPDASLAVRLIPLLVLAVPLSDAAYAILRRLAAGVNVFQADRGHLHHRLLDMGVKPLVAVRWLTLATVVGCSAGLVLLLAGWIGAVFVVSAVVAADVYFALRLQLFDRHVLEASVPRSE